MKNLIKDGGFVVNYDYETKKLFIRKDENFVELTRDQLLKIIEELLVNKIHRLLDGDIDENTDDKSTRK